MTPVGASIFERLRPLRRLRHGIGLGAVFLALACALAAAAAKAHFDLPADAAEKSLKRFSEQSGQEVLFASELTRGVLANRVKGELPPREAIDLLLANTGLVAVHDARTGAFSVRKEDPEEAKKDQRAARITARVRPMNQSRRRSAPKLPPP